MSLLNMKKIPKKEKVDLIKLSRGGKDEIKIGARIPEDLHDRFQIAIINESKRIRQKLSMNIVIAQLIHEYVKRARSDYVKINSKPDET